MNLWERISKLGVGTIILIVIWVVILIAGFIWSDRQPAKDYEECTAAYVRINGDQDCSAKQESGQDQYLQVIEDNAQ